MITPKILMVITNLGEGGAQRVFFDHAVAFSQKFQVKEVVFDHGEKERLYDSGLEILSLNVKGSNNLLGKISAFIKRPFRLRKIIKENKIDLVISHMDGANWVNTLTFTKSRKILVVHGTILHDYSSSRLMQWIRRKILIPSLYNKADLTVAVSEGIRNELINDCGIKNVKTIPNFFNVEEIQRNASMPLSQEWERLFLNNQILITSGRLHEQKKQKHLLPLFKKILTSHRNLKLIILGDGPLRNELFAEAKSLGLRIYSVWDKEKDLTNEFDVYFPGYVNNPFQFLQRSTLFVFPSGWEGFPLALCEAMISGVPVLAADCPTGPREIICPGTFDSSYSLKTSEESQFGVLLPMVDKANFEIEWENAIINLLSNPEKRSKLIHNGIERMKSFNKAAVMQQWFDEIERVAAN